MGDPNCTRLSKNEFDALLKKVSKHHMPKQELEALWKRVVNSDQTTADKWVIINVFLEDLGVRFGILTNKQPTGGSLFKRPSASPEKHVGKQPSVLVRKP